MGCSGFGGRPDPPGPARCRCVAQTARDGRAPLRTADGSVSGPPLGHGSTALARDTARCVGRTPHNGRLGRGPLSVSPSATPRRGAPQVPPGAERECHWRRASARVGCEHVVTGIRDGLHPRGPMAQHRPPGLLLRCTGSRLARGGSLVTPRGSSRTSIRCQRGRGALDRSHRPSPRYVTLLGRTGPSAHIEAVSRTLRSGCKSSRKGGPPSHDHP